MPRHDFPHGQAARKLTDFEQKDCGVLEREPCLAPALAGADERTEQDSAVGALLGARVNRDAARPSTKEAAAGE